MRTGDWIKFRCGDKVVAKCDPRHVGTIDCIKHGAIAVVRWPDTGWKTDFWLREIEPARRWHPAVTA